MRLRTVAAVLALVISAACIKIPEIVLVPVKPSAPVTQPVEPVAPPEPLPAIPSTPAPVVEPQPIVEPVEPEPFRNLNLTIRNVAARPIVGALVEQTLTGESRLTDGSGFANFGVREATELRISAAGYFPKALWRSPGDWTITLDELPKPKPVGGHTTGCEGDGRIIPASCLRAVAAASPNYADCRAGDPVACHRYVREVVVALRSTQADPGWGLISKPLGSMACTTKACGRDVRDGYGEDMVAYLPKGNALNRWTGVDIVVGAGARGAAHLANDTPMPLAIGGRASDLWAAVPE